MIHACTDHFHKFVLKIQNNDNKKRHQWFGDNVQRSSLSGSPKRKHHMGPRLSERADHTTSPLNEITYPVNISLKISMDLLAV